MPLFPGAFPAHRSGVDVRRGERGAIAFDVDGRRLCALNETALAVWELCDGATAPDEIVDAVRIACGLPEELAREDIVRTLTELTAVGLLSWQEPQDVDGD